MRRLGDLIDQIDLHGQNKELVDELVALSTKYGILTPYTSFLADERVQLHARAENAGRARQALRSLEQVDGAAGVSQRDFKQATCKRNEDRMRLRGSALLAENELESWTGRAGRTASSRVARGNSRQVG